jgi:hypothetical protein
MTKTPAPTWEEAIKDILSKIITRETHKGSVNRVRHQAAEAINKAALELVIGKDDSYQSATTDKLATPFHSYIPQNHLRAAQRRVVRGD